MNSDKCLDFPDRPCIQSECGYAGSARRCYSKRLFCVQCKAFLDPIDALRQEFTGRLLCGGCYRREKAKPQPCETLNQTLGAIFALVAWAVVCIVWMSVNK